MSTNPKQFTQQTDIPDGYWVDADQKLTRVDLVKPIDIQRDTLIGELITKALQLREDLRTLKASSFGDIEAFIALSAEEYGVNLGGKKGNVTLYSHDKRYKVVRAMQERLAFDERLQAAKTLIDECLNDWTKNAQPEIHVIITDAFAVDKEGKINTQAVLSLRRHKIEDERWVKAMNIIADAVQKIGSREYVRFYERIGDSDQYVAINLSFSGV